MKPKIKKHGRFWFCFGNCFCGWGKTPMKAWNEYKRGAIHDRNSQQTLAGRLF